VGPGEQYVDIVYHAELGLDEHLRTVYLENDMDPNTMHMAPAEWNASGRSVESGLGVTGRETAGKPEAFVLFERGSIEQRIVHGKNRVEQRRDERELQLMARQYAEYAQTADTPVTFEQYVEVRKLLSDQ